MNEPFLHYLWRYQKFDFTNLKTTVVAFLAVVRVGEPNSGSGPDFSNAQLRLDSLLFAGAVEIHLRSSGWYQHDHHKDIAYDGVVLHVVWEHDREVLLPSGALLPTLALKTYVRSETLSYYRQHFLQQQKALPCTPFAPQLPVAVWKHWRERLFLECLEGRLLLLQERLEVLRYDWEALLFERLARAFGLNRNRAVFEQLAQSIPFSVVRKVAISREVLEALFLGQAGLLSQTSAPLKPYGAQLAERFRYLQHKFTFPSLTGLGVQFGRLRPHNFPTLRLAQLAQLYHQFPQLFERIHQLSHLEGLSFLEGVGVSPYWQMHYSLHSTAPPVRQPQARKLTADFRSLLLINAVIPLLYAHANWQGRDRSDWLFQQMEAVPQEKNSRVDGFRRMGLPISTALDSQALLQLYPHYCERRRCLQCALGFFIMKQSP